MWVIYRAAIEWHCVPVLSFVGAGLILLLYVVQPLITPRYLKVLGPATMRASWIIERT